MSESIDTSPGNETRMAVRAPVDPPAPNVPAWEMIEPGRYRPRRIRGSFPGRELG